jgi:peroxiredoxin
MKARIIFFFFYSVLFLPFSITAQENGYTITGKIGDLKEGEKVLLLLDSSTGQGFSSDYEFVVNSAIVKDREFHLKGTVPDGPRRYFLKFGGSHSGRYIDFYIDNNENIVISSPGINTIPHGRIDHYVNIAGSPTAYSMFCLLPAAVQYYASIGMINNYASKIKDSLGFDGPLLDGLYTSRNEITRAFYANVYEGDQNPEDGRDPELKTANLYYVTTYGCFQKSGHAAVWRKVYNDLSEKRKNSFDGKWLKQLVSLCVGQPFPPFSLPDPNGKITAFSELIKKGKITLVQFWASTSSNRAEFQDELLGIYKRYHQKGLNVVGVSSDTNENEWKTMLKSTALPWDNVIDLKGEMVKNTYHEYGVRGNENVTNVLVDAQGKIIAWDVNGVELEWYLWKALDNK